MSSGGPKTELPAYSRPFQGYALIFIAVTFWGGSASLAKYLFASNPRIETLIISQTRSSFSFLLLAAYFALIDRSVFRVDPRDIVKLAVLGVFGIAVTNFAYYFTVQESTVATAILIQYTAPVLVMVYSVAVSKEEQVQGIKVLSLVLALSGCSLAVSGGSPGEIRLSGWVLATGITSSICFAFLLIASKKILRKYSTWTMLTYAFGFAGLFWIFVNPPWKVMEQGYTVSDWGVLWLFAVVSILIPHSLFTASLRKLDASTASIASTLEPVVAIVIAYFALGEALNMIQTLGAIAVVAAVILLQLRPNRFLSLSS
ncbi:MAG: EamA family transporter [Ignavibacteriales bacterium]|nr:EamA family transporter [Ignavibacteriales bacterium]